MTSGPCLNDPIPPAESVAPPGRDGRVVIRRWLEAVRERRTLTAIMWKDWRRQPVAWLIMLALLPAFGLMAVVSGLHEHHPKTPPLDAYVLAVMVILGVTAGEQVMGMEKGSRRLVLLRSLPLTERALVWAKFEATCWMAVPALAPAAAGRWWLGRSWAPDLLLLTVTIMAAAALTLLVTVWIRKPLWAFLFWGTPISAALMFFEPARTLLFQILRPEIPVLLGLTATTAAALEAAARILERRELEF
jgi:hypothetical protein